SVVCNTLDTIPHIQSYTPPALDSMDSLKLFGTSSHEKEPGFSFGVAVAFTVNYIMGTVMLTTLACTLPLLLIANVMAGVHLGILDFAMGNLHTCCNLKWLFC